MDDDVTLGQRLPLSPSSPRPSVAHPPPPSCGGRLAELVPVLLAQAVEAVVAQNLAGRPLGRSPPSAGSDQETVQLWGSVRSKRSTRAVPKNAVAPVMKNCRPVRASGRRVTTFCLPYGK